MESKTLPKMFTKHFVFESIGNNNDRCIGKGHYKFLINKPSDPSIDSVLQAGIFLWISRFFSSGI